MDVDTKTITHINPSRTSPPDFNSPDQPHFPPHQQQQRDTPLLKREDSGSPESISPTNGNNNMASAMVANGTPVPNMPGSGSGAGVNKRYRPAPAKTFQCRGYGECRMVFSRSEHLARHIRFVLFFLCTTCFLLWMTGNILGNAPFRAIAGSSSRASITSVSMRRLFMLISRTKTRG